MIKNQLDRNGIKVRLSQIHSSVLVIASIEHIIAASIIKPIMPLISSEDKTFETIKGGYVSIA